MGSLNTHKEVSHARRTQRIASQFKASSFLEQSPNQLFCAHVVRIIFRRIGELEGDSSCGQRRGPEGFALSPSATFLCRIQNRYCSHCPMDFQSVLPAWGESLLDDRPHELEMGQATHQYLHAGGNVYGFGDSAVLD